MENIRKFQGGHCKIEWIFREVPKKSISSTYGGLNSYCKMQNAKLVYLNAYSLLVLRTMHNTVSKYQNRIENLKKKKGKKHKIQAKIQKVIFSLSRVVQHLLSVVNSMNARHL